MKHRVHIWQFAHGTQGQIDKIATEVLDVQSNYVRYPRIYGAAFAPLIPAQVFSVEYRGVFWPVFEDKDNPGDYRLSLPAKDHVESLIAECNPAAVANMTAKRAKMMAEMANSNREKKAKMDDEFATNEAVSKAKLHMPHALKVIEERAIAGEFFAIVEEIRKYDKFLSDANPANAIMGEPRKNRALRKYPMLGKHHYWTYMAEELKSQGFQVSFEKSITSLDERGDDVYMLVCYWDN